MPPKLAYATKIGNKRISQTIQAASADGGNIRRF
jgi:hypothetical protein